MKKFLASLLSLVILTSSISVFCSANGTVRTPVEETETTPINEPGDTSANEAVSTPVDENVTTSVNETEINTTSDSSANSTDSEKKEASITNWAKIINDLFKNITSFYVAHPKSTVATAVVVTVGTIACVFRNEIKKLAKKTTNAAKRVFKKNQVNTNVA